jgi:trigger factor
LKIETQALEDRQVELTVEVPGDRLQAAMRSAARRLSRQKHIPGFRPGKAPYEIVVRKLGEETVFEEALESLGQEVYGQALESTELEPSAPGSLEEIVSRDPLVLRYTVPLVPEVDLDDYRDLRLPFEQPDVTDEAVEEVMDNLRQRQALIEPADRPAGPSDVVLLDVRAELLDPQEDENLTLLSEQGVSVLVDDETDWPVRGVAEHLTGIVAGQEKDFEHTFPDDYPNETLRGRRASFHVKCLEVKSRLVPDWTDDLARTLGGFEDLLDLRLKVRENLREQARQQAEAEYARQVVEAVVKRASVRFPPVLLEQELDDMIRDLDHRLQKQKLSLSDYLTIEKKSLEDLREELKPQAVERLQRALVLGKVVEAEGLDVEDQEVASELDRMSAPFEEQAHEVRQALDNPAGRRRIALNVLTDKAVERLIAIARGEADGAEEPEAESPQTSDQETQE